MFIDLPGNFPAVTNHMKLECCTTNS